MFNSEGRLLPRRHLVSKGQRTTEYSFIRDPNPLELTVSYPSRLLAKG